MTAGPALINTRESRHPSTGPVAAFPCSERADADSVVVIAMTVFAALLAFLVFPVAVMMVAAVGAYPDRNARRIDGHRMDAPADANRDEREQTEGVPITFH